MPRAGGARTGRTAKARRPNAAKRRRPGFHGDLVESNPIHILSQESAGGPSSRNLYIPPADKTGTSLPIRGCLCANGVWSPIRAVLAAFLVLIAGGGAALGRRGSGSPDPPPSGGRGPHRLQGGPDHRPGSEDFPRRGRHRGSPDPSDRESSGSTPRTSALRKPRYGRAASRTRSASSREARTSPDSPSTGSFRPERSSCTWTTRARSTKPPRRASSGRRTATPGTSTRSSRPPTRGARFPASTSPCTNRPGS